MLVYIFEIACLLVHGPLYPISDAVMPPEEYLAQEEHVKRVFSSSSSDGYEIRWI
jgi:hypothetical protein